MLKLLLRVWVDFHGFPFAMCTGRVLFKVYKTLLGLRFGRGGVTRRLLVRSSGDVRARCCLDAIIAVISSTLCESHYHGRLGVRVEKTGDRSVLTSLISSTRRLPPASHPADCVDQPGLQAAAREAAKEGRASSPRASPKSSPKKSPKSSPKKSPKASPKKSPKAAPEVLPTPVLSRHN